MRISPFLVPMPTSLSLRSWSMAEGLAGKPLSAILLKENRSFWIWRRREAAALLPPAPVIAELSERASSMLSRLFRLVDVEVESDEELGAADVAPCWLLVAVFALLLLLLCVNLLVANLNMVISAE